MWKTFFSIFSGYYMLHRIRVVFLYNSMTSDHTGPHASDFCAGCRRVKSLLVRWCDLLFTTLVYTMYICRLPSYIYIKVTATCVRLNVFLMTTPIVDYNFRRKSLSSPLLIFWVSSLCKRGNWRKNLS